MSDNGFDFSSEAFRLNPYPMYDQMRESGGPIWMPHSGATGGMWLFTRYDDVLAIFKEARASKDIRRVIPDAPQGPYDIHMLTVDPPDHTRLRSLVNLAFTPKRIKALEPSIQKIADDLLAHIREHGGAEFVHDFAFPLPVIVIAELLGVPISDRELLRKWSIDLVAGMDATRKNRQEVGEGGAAATLAMGEYFAELIAKRRHEPRADLVSALIQASVDQDRLSETEMIATCILLLVAGHETTVNLLTTGMLTLLKHPGQMEFLRENPQHLPMAVEEMLRYESPVQRATFRIAIEDFAINGAVIERGKQISAVIGAANRDPAYFIDPGRFDACRQPNRHLAFGQGMHFCLGAPLARLEARIAFERILSRLPEMRMVSDSPAWRHNTFVRGLESLPLAF